MLPFRWFYLCSVFGALFAISRLASFYSIFPESSKISKNIWQGIAVIVWKIFETPIIHAWIPSTLLHLRWFLSTTKSIAAIKLNEENQSTDKRCLLEIEKRELKKGKKENPLSLMFFYRKELFSIGRKAVRWLYHGKSWCVFFFACSLMKNYIKNNSNIENRTTNRETVNKRKIVNVKTF